MIKKSRKYSWPACLILLLVWPGIVLAAKANPPLNALNGVAVDAGFNPVTGTTLSEIIGTVIGMALSLVGIIFLVLMLYAGYNWMTARGEEEKVSHAKDTIIRALVGIIIVVGSYALWQFVFSRLF